MQELEFVSYHKPCFENIQFFNIVSLRTKRLQNTNRLFTIFCRWCIRI